MRERRAARGEDAWCGPAGTSACELEARQLPKNSALLFPKVKAEFLPVNHAPEFPEFCLLTHPLFTLTLSVCALSLQVSILFLRLCTSQPKNSNDLFKNKEKHAYKISYFFHVFLFIFCSLCIIKLEII